MAKQASEILYGQNQQTIVYVICSKWGLLYSGAANRAVSYVHFRYVGRPRSDYVVARVIQEMIYRQDRNSLRVGHTSTWRGSELIFYMQR